MTKVEAIKAIELLAKVNGFDAKESNWSDLPEIRGENMLFWLDSDRHFDFEERTITTKVTARASISRMGGNPTTDELFTVANEITRGATLVDSINLMDIVIVENMEA